MTALALTTELQKFNPSAKIELYEVDITSLGGDAYFFFAGKNQQSQPIVWQGQVYTPWPVAATGFDFDTTGQIPRPKMTFSNVAGTITALILQYKDLLGGKVTRRRTLAKFLDAVNFPGGVNADADPTAGYPDDIFYLNQRAHEDNEHVEYELASAHDVSGVQLPRRQIIQNICPWKYRGAECSYIGPPVAKSNDQQLTIMDALSVPAKAVMNTWSAYINAFAATNAARINLGLTSNNLNIANQYVMLEDRYLLSPPASFVAQTNGSIVTAKIVNAVWGGNAVTIGATYRIGAASGASYKNMQYYHIQRWGPDPAAVVTATGALSTAQIVLNAAIATESAALSAYNAAYAALPSNDSLLIQDSCGKRLSSCKLRFAQEFQSGELPFGGFPAAGLSRQ